MFSFRFEIFLNNVVLTVSQFGLVLFYVSIFLKWNSLRVPNETKHSQFLFVVQESLEEANNPNMNDKNRWPSGKMPLSKKVISRLNASCSFID